VIRALRFLPKRTSTCLVQVVVWRRTKTTGAATNALWVSVLMYKEF
jgi:hypothetical protein